MGRRPEWTFFQRGNVNGQQVHKEIVKTANNQGHANPNHNEVPPHISQNGCHQNEDKQ